MEDSCQTAMAVKQIQVALLSPEGFLTDSEKNLKVEKTEQSQRKYYEITRRWEMKRDCESFAKRHL